MVKGEKRIDSRPWLLSIWKYPDLTKVTDLKRYAILVFFY
jgi:hypothetical protein